MDSVCLGAMTVYIPLLVCVGLWSLHKAAGEEKSLVETWAASCTFISVNDVVLQVLMHTPQDCKVMWVAANSL